MSATTKVLVAQIEARAGDVEGNLAQLESCVAEAAAQGAHVLLTPEMALQGYDLAPEQARALAEPADGPSLSRLAAQLPEGLVVAVGFAEARADGQGQGQPFNSLALLTAAGPLHVYRKTHLWGPDEPLRFAERPEPLDFGAGALARHPATGLAMAGLVCYDVEFPEPARRLALAGAELLLVATACGQTHECLPQRAMVPVRAKENQLAVAYANLAGPGWAGQSCVVGADGLALAATESAAPVVLAAEVDPALAARAAERNPYRRDVRVSL